MDLSLPYLRELAPWLPADLRDLRWSLDMSGIEVKAVDAHQVSVELLANRGDHRCVEGVLRELCGYLRPVSVQGCYTMDVALADDSGWQIADRRIELDPGSSLAYELVEARLPADVAGAFAPELTTLLDVAGVPLGGALCTRAADIVCLELGQPLQTYDADQVVGDVSVTLSAGGETVRLLDEATERVLPEGILVVRDAVKVLSIAGITGSAESAVSPNSTRILVEAAAFDPVLVRRSAQRLRLSSMASQRFERGSDPTQCRRGLKRFLAVLEASGFPADVVAVTTTEIAMSPREVQFSPECVGRVLGKEVSDERVWDSLARHGFVQDGGMVRIPTWRHWDVFEAADLVEVVAQALDYSSVVEKVPAGVLATVATPDETAVGLINQILVSRSFFEVIGDSFQNDAVLAPLRGFDVEPMHRRGELIQLSNSVDPGNGLLRRATLPTALAIAAGNSRVGLTEGAVFEWGRVYAPLERMGEVREDEVLWLAAFSKSSADLGHALVRRVVDDFAELFGANAELVPLDLGRSSVLHRGQSAAIVVSGQRVGIVGSVASPVVARLGGGIRSLVYAEFDVPDLLRSLLTEVPRPRSKVRSHLAMRRELSFWLEQNVPVGDVLKALLESSADFTQRFDIAIGSVYQGENGRAATFSISLDRTEWSDRAAASDAVVTIGREAERLLGSRIRLRVAF